MTSRIRRLAIVLAAALLIAILATSSFADDPTPVATSGVSAAGDPVLVAAGDIAVCGETGAQQTAALLEAIDGTVVALGDNAYEDGAPAAYACYDSAWGPLRDRTRPVPGNHDYYTPGAADYFAYFGASAGDSTLGYYSYDLGSWHIIALNSNCGNVGGCNIGSAQEQWLRSDLAAHPTLCTLAYWHHPRFSSGPHGNDLDVQPLWETLYQGGADVVLNGHDHLYERFAPQDPDGNPDPVQGIRQFTVGTGGASHYRAVRLAENSEALNDNTFGVLKLTLHSDGYDWQFIPIAGATFTDAGSASCHT